mgnify:CR=1 FL=1
MSINKNSTLRYYDNLMAMRAARDSGTLYQVMKKGLASPVNEEIDSVSSKILRRREEAEKKKQTSLSSEEMSKGLFDRFKIASSNGKEIQEMIMQAKNKKEKELSNPTGTSNKISSDNLVDFIIGLEGFKEKAYWDVRQYTVGYGTKAKSKTEVITKEEALNRLNEELQVAKKAVDNLEKDYDEPFTEGQKNALISFTYNAGPGNLKQLSQDGTRGVEEIGDMLLEYVYAGEKKLPGLVKRREKEYNLFNKGFQNE